MDSNGLAEALKTDVKAKAQEALDKFSDMKINIAQTERWASAAIGGGLLAYGLRKRSWKGLLFGLVGGGLLLRGVLGKSMFYKVLSINTATGEGLPGQDDGNAIIRVDKAIVIERSAEDLYAFLREVENLPRVLRHLKAVRSVDSKRSRWAARMPAGADLEWDAEIHEERKHRKIAWRTGAESALKSEGALILDPIGDGKKTQVGIHLEYHLPTGKVGKEFGKLFGKHPDRLIDEELHRFKTNMEGEP